jgi:hypothetical protein
MVGIIVNYNGEQTKAAIKNGMIIVDLFNSNGDSPALFDGESRMYIGGVDYEQCKRVVWRDSSPVEIGDRFEVRIAEIDAPSSPVRVAESQNMNRPKTKLEFFCELELDLKKQGLI